jgi:hypothetical protein
MDTGIGMLFVGAATWFLGYGPVEMLATQAGFLVLEFAGRRAIDWYVARA